MPPVLPDRGSDSNASVPRVITYYQTHHTREGKPISILPVLADSPRGHSVTHVILAAIHINDDPAKITLNDHHPSHPRFSTLWGELRTLQENGVKVLGMLGGAAKGSYTRLDLDQSTFDRYWGPVRDMIREHALDGIDLDVEEEMSLDGIIRLIDRIRADFGKGFIISMAPVAAAMLDPTKNLSGFDYEMLEMLRGEEIGWYNVQFYNGWGHAGDPMMYEMMMAKGWPRRKIVVGLITNPENGGGWVPWGALGAVLSRIGGSEFGGVSGWEYFNGLPSKERPWEWAGWMSAMLRPGSSSATIPAAPSSGSTAPLASPPALANGTWTGNVTEQQQRVLAVEEVDPDEPGGKDAPVPKAFTYHSDGEG